MRKWFEISLRSNLEVKGCQVRSDIAKPDKSRNVE